MRGRFPLQDQIHDGPPTGADCSTVGGNSSSESVPYSANPEEEEKEEDGKDEEEKVSATDEVIPSGRCNYLPPLPTTMPW